MLSILKTMLAVIIGHIFGKIINDSLPKDLSIQNIWKHLKFALPIVLILLLGCIKVRFLPKEEAKIFTFVIIGLVLFIALLPEWKKMTTQTKQAYL